MWGDIMSIRDDKCLLRKMLSGATILPNNKNEIERLLNKLDKENDRDFLTLKGIYCLKTNKLEEAKQSFTKALLTNKDDYFIYYGLYAIAVREKNYVKAYNYAVMCEETMPVGVDFSLQVAVSKANVDMDNSILDGKYYIDNNFRKGRFMVDKVASLYDQAIVDFNNGNFIAARMKVAEIAKRKEYNGSTFDFAVLLDSIDSLILQIKDYSMQPIIDTNGEVVFDEELYDEAFCQRLLNYINMTISFDLELARKMFDNNKEQLEKYADPCVINYVVKRMEEKQRFRQVSREEFELYNNYLNEIKKAFNSFNFKRAYTLSAEALKNTGFAVFDYYAGKSLYKIGIFDYAEQYLLRYLDHASTKFVKANHYLANIYRRSNHSDVAQQLDRESDILASYFVSEWELNNSKKRPNRKRKKKKPLVTVDGVRGDIDKYMETACEFKIEDFDTYSFAQKMAFIRSLHMNNHSKVADKLMKKVSQEATDTVYRKVIGKEKEVSVLYKAKAKYGQS